MVPKALVGPVASYQPDSIVPISLVTVFNGHVLIGYSNGHVVTLNSQDLTVEDVKTDVFLFPDLISNNAVLSYVESPKVRSVGLALKGQGNKIKFDRLFSVEKRFSRIAHVYANNYVGLDSEWNLCLIKGGRFKRTEINNVGENVRSFELLPSNRGLVSATNSNPSRIAVRRFSKNLFEPVSVVDGPVRIIRHFCDDFFLLSSRESSNPPVVLDLNSRSFFQINGLQGEKFIAHPSPQGRFIFISCSRPELIVYDWEKKECRYFEVFDSGYVSHVVSVPYSCLVVIANGNGTVSLFELRF